MRAIVCLSNTVSVKHSIIDDEFELLVHERIVSDVFVFVL